LIDSQQKVVLRVPTMTDDKIKQKAIEAVADIYGNILHPLIDCFPDDRLFCSRDLENMF
jgi:hypothetical protein